MISTKSSRITKDMNASREPYGFLLSKLSKKVTSRRNKDKTTQ